MAKGGNYLLNVGPRPDGTIDEACASILRRIGKWYHTASESLVGVVPASSLTSNREVVLTRRGNTLYVHVVKEPETRSIFLPLLTELPRRATLLNSGEEVACEVAALPRLHNQKPNECLRLKHLPVNNGSTAGWVFKLDFERPPNTINSNGNQEETK
jgi:alpha-L-fucosidase